MNAIQRMRKKESTIKGLLITGLLLMVLVVPSQAVLGVTGADGGSEITILHHQSQILQTPWKVVRVAVTDPTIADIQVLTADQVLIQGLAIGTTDILLWSEDDTQVLQKKVSVTLDVDSIVLAAGSQPRTQLRESLEGHVSEVFLVGDCVAPRGILEAIHEGSWVGRQI